MFVQNYHGLQQTHAKSVIQWISEITFLLLKFLFSSGMKGITDFVL